MFFVQFLCVFFLFSRVLRFVVDVVAVVRLQVVSRMEYFSVVRAEMFASGLLVGMCVICRHGPMFDSVVGDLIVVVFAASSTAM